MFRFILLQKEKTCTRFVYCFEISERLKALFWPRIHEPSVEPWFVKFDLRPGILRHLLNWFGILLRLTSVILFYFYLIYIYIRSKHLISLKPIARGFQLELNSSKEQLIYRLLQTNPNFKKSFLHFPKFLLPKNPLKRNPSLLLLLKPASHLAVEQLQIPKEQVYLQISQNHLGLDHKSLLFRA